MKTENNFRSKVLKQAWSMVRTNAVSLSIAMIQAWKSYRLVQKLTTTEMCFYFKKANGEIRTAIGTLKTSLIGEVKGTGTEQLKSQVYWDMEKESFRAYSLINLL